jgi:sporulation protein YlmC with PRC-barrel domain
VEALRAGAGVEGTDGRLGTVDALVIDPLTAEVTHLVVSRGRFGRRLLVPVAHVRSSTPDVVAVDLDDEALGACARFDDPEPGSDPADAGAGADPGADAGPGAEDPMPALGYRLTTLGYEPGAFFLEAVASPTGGWVSVGRERIPEGEITIRRGDEVRGSDGTRVGHVDEVVIDPADRRVSHVVVREGLLRHRDVVVPLGGARFEEGRVVLDLDATALDRLERLPVARHRHVTP